MLTRNLLVAGRGCSFLRNRLYITSLRDHLGPSFPGQCLSTLVLRYRDAKISLYLWHNAVYINRTQNSSDAFDFHLVNCMYIICHIILLLHL